MKPAKSTIKTSMPIGIFDSGIGGLTVAHAVSQLLPNENILYFGDTAHLPYGEKSTAAIQSYSIKICNLFLEQACKLILIACNSASAAAFDLVKEYVGSRAHVFNVIDPVIDYLIQHHPSQKIGLIGTRQTVNSAIYQQKIEALHAPIQLQMLATPLLAPMIEQGFHSGKIVQHVIEDYLADQALQGIEALVLACTHYPLIEEQIKHYYNHQLPIIDSPTLVANALKRFLEEKQLLYSGPRAQMKFYLSDYTPTFASSAKWFFGKQVILEHYPLWD